MTNRGDITGKFRAESLARERRMGPQFAKPGPVRYARQLTGTVLSAVESLMASRISVQGTHNIPPGPVLFVANHFTRSETFILPYIIDRYARRTALSLAHWGLFKGLFGDYLRAIGALPTRHPGIKQRIVEDLLTGRSDWLIYPEGAMIKNKKLWKDGRFHLETPERSGSPHTGSAVLALQAIIYDELHQRAEREGDQAALALYRQRFRIEEPLPHGFHIVPINISYYPIRPGPNALYRLARLLVPQLPHSLEEELTIEGSLLFKQTDITIYFGQPIDSERYRVLLRPGLEAVRHGDEAAINEMIGALKHRLTTRLMGEVYRRLTVNIDHLVCSAIRHRRKAELSLDDLRAMVYLAARELQSRGQRRIHRTIDGSLVGLLTGERNPALNSILTLAEQTGVAMRDGNLLRLDHSAMERQHAFADVRVRNPIGVIANELEPLREAVHAVTSVVNEPSQHLRHRIADLLVAEDLVEFEADRHAAEVLVASGSQPALKAREVCAPFLLRSQGKAEIGVVLSHGYLAAPGEIRALAEHLAAQGFFVYGPRLKGHGSATCDLGVTTWQEWQGSFDRALAVVRHACRHVVVAGFSAGGLLALRAAARRAPGVVAAVAIAPAIELLNPSAHFASGVVAWNRVLSRVGASRGRWEWVANAPEFSDTNYERNYLGGVRELQRLIRATWRDLAAIRVPTLVVQADCDPVISPHGVARLVARLGCDEKDFVRVASPRHGILRGEGAAVVHERIAEWLRDRVGNMRGERHEARPGSERW